MGFVGEAGFFGGEECEERLNGWRRRRVGSWVTKSLGRGFSEGEERNGLLREMSEFDEE